MAGDAARLMELLGLDEDELCMALGLDPLTLLADAVEHRPQVAILRELVEEAGEQAGPAVLARWVRAGRAGARPLDALLAQDYAAFEARLAELAERGFVLRGGG